MSERLKTAIGRELTLRTQLPERPRNEPLEALLGLNQLPVADRPRRERTPQQRADRRAFLRKQRAGAAERRAEALANWGGDPRTLYGDQCKQTKGLRPDEFYLDLGARLAERLPKVAR